MTYEKLRRPIRVAVVSVVPSPYQRDLFGALAKRPEVELLVHYMEHAAPDSPWPEKALRPWERMLPGFWVPVRHARVHVNWRLPSPGQFDILICNTLMSLTAQWLMRVGVTDRKWIFFGERMTGEGPRHALFAGPLKRASAIAAIGSWAMEDYKRRYPSVPVFNIPYHCELAPFMELGRSPRGSDAPVTFLFCGQMIARKGLDHLLAAFALLPPAARLLLVGREAELSALLEPLPATVRERIEYAGFQAPEALAGFFAKADVFVLPSRHDGWGVVVNQAIAAGLPVIVSDHVGAGFDCVRSGENGFVFPMGDVPALATALRHFIDAPEDIARFGARSREIAVDFTPSIGAEKWVRALAAVSGRDEFGTVLKPEPMNRVVV